MSIAGGHHLALQRAASVGCEAVQVFTKSSRQWAAPPLREDEVQKFRDGLAAGPVKKVIAHDSYLLNLGSPDAAQRSRAVGAFVDELERCSLLNIPWLVAHPGAHVGSGEAAGLAAISDSLTETLTRTKGLQARPALEITAGQGTTLGHNFEQIAKMLEETKRGEEIGVCFDTEHAFAAGYDLSTAEGYEKTFADFERIIGLKRIVAFHLNDSKKPLGSKVDRHEQIGKGEIGAGAFKRLVNDKRFWGLPMCLETEKSEDLHEDKEALDLLRSFLPEN
jgi:deoxyribonuclease-4